VLSDPERVMSKRHCVIAWRGGAWQIADTSTNGTFINRDATPLGPGVVHRLSDGDRIRFGAYEIEARVQSPARQPTAPPRQAYGDAFGDDPFATPTDPLAASAAAPEPDSWFGGANTIALPADFDPLAPDESLFGTPVADHSSPQQDAFRPPPMAPRLLPDDWDLSLSPIKPASPLPPMTPVPSAPVPAAPGSAAPGSVAPVPVARVAPPPLPPPLGPSPPLPTSDASSATDLLVVFLTAAGMEDQPRTGDPAEVMRRLGGAFRAMVAGLRQSMIARAAIKGEFRIEQTMIRTKGNNPLKFSADDDDAMAALLGIGRRTDMEADAAVSDALRDVRLHEMAVMGAMQAAVRALLARLDPVALRAEGEQGRAMIPAQRKARAFDAFEALHGEITRALTDDFDSVFGKAFAREYERALSEAEAHET
jgi:type VI secretion system protein ImpI/type VI secretion system protein